MQAQHDLAETLHFQKDCLYVEGDVAPVAARPNCKSSGCPPPKMLSLDGWGGCGRSFIFTGGVQTLPELWLQEQN
eukprot:5556484-Amphidinium_carterae.1